MSRERPIQGTKGMTMNKLREAAQALLNALADEMQAVRAALAEQAAPSTEVDEAQLARLRERGAVAWAGWEQATQAVEPARIPCWLNSGECIEPSYCEKPGGEVFRGSCAKNDTRSANKPGCGHGEQAAPDAPAAETLQSRVQPWLIACFGVEIAGDRAERNHRFLEESLELVQACGCTASEAHQLIDYVFGRPAGEPDQEVGGVMITLAALCLANDLDMHAAGERELSRIWTMVEKIRAKQAAKPKHSPLPAAAPVAAPAGGGGCEAAGLPARARRYGRSADARRTYCVPCRRASRGRQFGPAHSNRRSDRGHEGE